MSSYVSVQTDNFQSIRTWRILVNLGSLPEYIKFCNTDNTDFTYSPLNSLYFPYNLKTAEILKISLLFDFIVPNNASLLLCQLCIEENDLKIKTANAKFYFN